MVQISDTVLAQRGLKPELRRETLTAPGPDSVSVELREGDAEEIGVLLVRQIVQKVIPDHLAILRRDASERREQQPVPPGCSASTPVDLFGTVLFGRTVEEYLPILRNVER